MTDRIFATYLLESPRSVEQAAEILAGEMSTGTFIPVPGETPALKERYRTSVELVEAIEETNAPAFGQPPALTSSRYFRARVTVSIPCEMIGTDLTTVQASVLGNITELKEVSALRLLDLELPSAFVQSCAQPRYGIEGTRTLTEIHEGPLVGAVVKPAVGLTPERFGNLVSTLVEAGADFVKDDELMADPPYCPFVARVDAVMRILKDHTQRTGRQVMYAFNITGPVDEMMRRHDTVAAAGGTCVQVNLNQAGMSALAHVRRHGALVIHGHRSGWGQFSRQAWFGMDFKPYALLWRLVGVDHLVVTGIRSKFWEPDDSCLAGMRACLTPIQTPGDRVMPAVGSAQWGGQAPEMVASLGSSDLIYIGGAAVLGHPGGPTAGVAAIRQAWEAALSGIPLAKYAREHPALAQSLAKFSGSRGL